MAIIRVYGYKTPPGPLSDQDQADNDITEQVQVDPELDARALELQTLYGYTPGRGIQTVDTAPVAPHVHAEITQDALAAADTAISDESLDAAGLRASLIAFRSAITITG